MVYLVVPLGLTIDIVGSLLPCPLVLSCQEQTLQVLVHLTAMEVFPRVAVTPFCEVTSWANTPEANKAAVRVKVNIIERNILNLRFNPGKRSRATDGRGYLKLDKELHQFFAVPFG